MSRLGRKSALTTAQQADFNQEQLVHDTIGGVGSGYVHSGLSPLRGACSWPELSSGP